MLPSGTFLFVGEPSVELEEATDYLVFDKSLAIIDLMEEIQRIFQRYEEWENNMQRAAINGQDLKKLGMLSTAILDNPIQFYNQKTLNCIFNAYEEGKYELPDSFPEVSESGYMQPELLVNLKIENILSTVAESPMLIIRDNLTLPAIMQDMVIDGSTMGRLIVFQVHKKLDERDMSLLMVFTDFLKQVLMYNPKLYNVHSQFIDVTLSRLIEGNQVRDPAIFSLLQIWNWNVEDAYFCLAAKLPVYDKDPSSLNTLAVAISQKVNCNCYLTHDDAVVFVFNLSASGKTRDMYLKQLLPMLRDNLLKAGISTVFHDFRKLHAYYVQALEGLKIGMKTDPSFWYFRFENYAIRYLTDQLTQKMDVHTFCPEKLLELMEIDRKKQNQYVHILKTWLACGMNISETAKRVYMHRNTLLYKLDRIKEILGNTLENYESRLLLMLALQILEYEGEERI